MDRECLQRIQQIEQRLDALELMTGKDQQSDLHRYAGSAMFGLVQRPYLSTEEVVELSISMAKALIAQLREEAQDD